MALIHTVEPLEDPFLILFCDADPIVAHRPFRSFRGSANAHMNPAPILVVFDGVVCQIKEHLIEQMVNPMDADLLFSVERHGNMLRFGITFQILHGIRRQL